MQTVPDVGMQVGGCPGDAILPSGPDRSAVFIWVDGQIGGEIGTSASSPEFVSAVALFVQKEGGRVGNINPYLYAYGVAQRKAGGRTAPAASQLYHMNINGNDGYWTQNSARQPRLRLSGWQWHPGCPKNVRSDQLSRRRQPSHRDQPLDSKARRRSGSAPGRWRPRGSPGKAPCCIARDVQTTPEPA